MKIKVERSGGMTGIPSSHQIETNELPRSVSTIVDEIMKNSPANSSSLKSAPQGAADYYTYKITLGNGKNKRIIECSQFSLQSDLKSLVKYVEQNSKTG